MAKENHSILNGSLIRDSKAWETRVTCCVAPVGLSSPNLNVTFGSAVAKRALKGHVALPRHRLGMSTEPRIISNSRWYWVQLMLPRVYHWILRLRLAWISMEFYIIILLYISLYHDFGETFGCGILMHVNNVCTMFAYSVVKSSSFASSWACAAWLSIGWRQSLTIQRKVEAEVFGRSAKNT